jgi:beta-alanine degradation protein BauB
MPCQENDMSHLSLKISIVGNVVLVSLTVLLATSLLAQDMVKVAPKNCTVVLDNDRVRVIRVVLKPGEKLPMHSHPANIVYTENSGKAKYTFAGGKTEEREAKAGQATWSEAISHSTENTGTTETHAVVVEIKK